MRNATPLILVIFIAGLATFLSLRDKPASKDPKPPVAVAPVTWPAEKSDIPADPKAVFGTMDNGMRYIILPNSEPPQRLSMRLHVAAGSLMEQNDQQGVAHFLEHMVFNGTKNFENANQLIREMQSRGIAFGAGANAYTSFNETVYELDLPDLKSDNLDLTFKIMRDFADGALLSEKEIDEERGVILSEKGARDTVGYRIQKKQFESLLPESLIPKRFPIGEEEIIKNAKRERFADFYQRYYVPSNMTFVIVGDVDPGEIEERIKSTFGSMKSTESKGETPDIGKVTIPDGLVTHVFSDPELDSTDVSLLLVRPFEFIPDSKQSRAAKYPLDIAGAIIGRRFERLSKVENSPITAGEAGKFDLFNHLELGSISVTAADDRWQEATSVLEQEFRRALTHGFTEAELNEAKANLLNAYQEAVKRKDTRESESLAKSIISTIGDQTVFTTPEISLEIATEALNQITPESVHQAFVKFWKAPGHHLLLTTKSATPETEKELASLYQKSAGTEVAPPSARAITPFAYTNFGTAGEIEKTTTVDDLGITQITLSNNIRVNLKPTDFEQNRIRILARIGTGQLSQPADKPLLNAVATAVFGGGGLAKHSNDELAEILAGRNVSSSLSIAEDAFILSGSTTPDDQLLQLQFMVASITDPGYRPEGLWQFQKNIPVIFQNLKHTPAGPSQEMETWLYGSDSRYSIPTQTKLSNYTIEDVVNWLSPELHEGYIEISIVGDFDPEAITQDLLKTFGTLPPRDLKPSTQTVHKRSVKFPNPPQEKTFTYESKIPQALATGIWKTDGLRKNTNEARRLNVLSDIFGDRLREEIREKLGASYSPNAGATGSDALEGFGYLIGQASGKPEDIPLLLNTMNTIASELAEKGAAQDELDRSLTPILSSLEKSNRDNSYWLSTVLSQSQSDPARLDLARERDEDYRSIKLTEINALAKKYFPASNLHKVSILPK
ncbi:MAG: insulinase family protein [Verrucomicrobiota bacterium]